MRTQRLLATAAVFTALTALTACEGGDRTTEKPGASTAATASPKASATPVRVPETATGLPSAGSLKELGRLVHDHHSVDCTHFSTDPQTVAVQSIDYLPAVDGDPKTWSIRERGLCGETAGAQRAHNLVWLSTIDDMRVFEAHEKAAQMKEVKENGHIRATRSKALIGRDVVVETNDPADRHGLYQQQFLWLNCQPGFTAPQGYRLEKSMTEGCVLTNYEPEGQDGFGR